MTSFHEGEGFAADKSVAVRSIGVLLPEIARKENGEVFIGCGCW